MGIYIGAKLLINSNTVGYQSINVLIYRPHTRRDYLRSKTFYLIKTQISTVYFSIEKNKRY